MKKRNTLSEGKKPKSESSRRSFLKKSIYAAPTIVALGALLKPTESKAGFGPTPSDANGGNW